MDPVQASASAPESEESEESEAASPEGEPACGPSLPPDGKDEDDALCPETLLKNLKAARKALLWERAVAQRLRKALDMAEAWAPADETTSQDSEVSRLQSTIALQKQEIAELQQSVQDGSCLALALPPKVHLARRFVFELEAHAFGWPHSHAVENSCEVMRHLRLLCYLRCFSRFVLSAINSPTPSLLVQMQRQPRSSPFLAAIV
ncbi:unnamed protein product [Symbiodinium sp. KB8]|nr:unnamed protein product [Symbiodinium sp. KB8]